jgi:cobalt-zinc-cadmium efflux system membrane fusion protein
MTDNLFTISNLKNVWVYANVYEADISKIKEGYTVQVLPLSYPDKVFKGKIDMVSQVLDPQSKALKVRINLDNEEMLLKPDMFTKVIVSNEEGTRSLCIPSASVVQQDGKNYVVVYVNDSDLKVAQIGIVKTVENKTYINSGLNPGDKLISKNQILIFNQLTSQ